MPSIPTSRRCWRTCAARRGSHPSQRRLPDGVSCPRATAASCHDSQAWCRRYRALRLLWRLILGGQRGWRKALVKGAAPDQIARKHQATLRFTLRFLRLVSRFDRENGWAGGWRQGGWHAGESRGRFRGALGGLEAWGSRFRRPGGGRPRGIKLLPSGRVWIREDCLTR
jgi:hypothetical protein